MKAIQVTQYGSPEVLSVVDLPTPQLKSTEILIDMKVTGYNSTMLQPAKASFPIHLIPVRFVLGVEGAGVVAEIGADVTQVKVGDRVSFNVEGADSYANQVVIGSDRAR